MESQVYNRIINKGPPFKRRNLRTNNAEQQLQSQYEKEVQSHNIDSKHFPHQYAIQIRWGRPGQGAQYVRPANNYRLMNDETSRYRHFAHQEEEHWHDKKWINLGSPSIGIRNEIEYAVSDSKFRTLPVYVRPIKNGANIGHVSQHFAVPSKSFPVNQRFVQWANSPVNWKPNRWYQRGKPPNNMFNNRRMKPITISH